MLCFVPVLHGRVWYVCCYIRKTVTAINPDDNYDSGILDMSPGDIVENDSLALLILILIISKIREIQSAKIIPKNLLISLLISKIIFLFIM